MQARKEKKKRNDYNAIIEKLEELYPDAGSELFYSSTFQLMIAVILSAQTTDKQVNKVTTDLFVKYPDAGSFAHVEPEDVLEDIRGVGLSNGKSKNIVETCRILTEKYGGIVPDTMEELLALPGIGRKSANVILSNAFGQDAIAVDTHVFRVGNRLGIGHGKNVTETEKNLQKNIDKNKWSKAHHLLIWHGRRVCKAKNPRCDSCVISEWCEYYLNKI